ncbi:MAG: hydroxymethylbilane synthase [Desulfotomaculum sp.]|nr:hydroxymethylbilane synthase [Desulfotomaculum sp.]
MKKKVIVGTRESALAMWQTNWVVEQLQRNYPEIKLEIVKIKTRGDRILDVALAKIGDKGLFTKELELAMLQGEIDLAVHSIKDLPTKLPEGLIIGAVCKREHPGDVLVSREGQRLEELPPGAQLGTSSLRRSAQLLRYRPDFKPVSIRGNLNTRIKKLQSEKLDAIILAAAGMLRMGWSERITQYIPPQICLPAVGQGAIGIEIRAGDATILQLVKSLEHRESLLAIEAERALLRQLEGGCQVPIGAFGIVFKNNIRLEAAVVSIDGTKQVRLNHSGTAEQAAEVGTQLAERLLANGAGEILAGLAN